MTAWTAQGIRLDIALAVVMEVAVLQMNRAHSADERNDALAFNEELWNVAGRLAPAAPVAEDRDALVAAARVVKAGGKGIEQLAEINRRFAGLLAGRAATDGALGHILDRWRAARRDGVGQEFGPWLLTLLNRFVGYEQAVAA
jgi:hypothetical protein